MNLAKNLVTNYKMIIIIYNKNINKYSLNINVRLECAIWIYYCLFLCKYLFKIYPNSYQYNSRQ